MRFYIDNFKKLFDQDEEWYWRRFYFVKQGNWEQADKIEKYLILINNKIVSLAKRALYDLYE